MDDRINEKAIILNSYILNQFKTIKSNVLIEDLILSSGNVSNPRLFSNNRVIYFYPNDTLNDLIKVLFIRENKFLALNKIDFQTVVSKNLHDLNALINSADINISVDFSEAPSVFFDANYLESILLNLMSNSIKFSSPDRKIEISMKSRKEGEFTILEFSDNGIGMDMDRIKDRIFGLYQRFHDRSDSKGIGLYLIHSQVTALGGKISVKSKVDEGTTFYITFKQTQEKVQ